MYKYMCLYMCLCTWILYMYECMYAQMYVCTYAFVYLCVFYMCVCMNHVCVYV